MIGVVCRIGVRLIFPATTNQLRDVQPVHKTIPAPPKQLVNAYLSWCNASDHYQDCLPPHMVSQWGLPLIAELLFQTPYALTRVLNQGVTLDIHGELPRDQPLLCHAFVNSIADEAHRTRISVTVQTGTAQVPNLVEVTLHMVFINTRTSKTGSRDSGTEAHDWTVRGIWRASEHDGLLFSLITGDFNPIHWSTLAGKLSALHNKILQGFGTFARTFEQLDSKRVARIEVRFLRPVPLPSAPLYVEQSATPVDKTVQVRVRGADHTLHLVGNATLR